MNFLYAIILFHNNAMKRFTFYIQINEWNLTNSIWIYCLLRITKQILLSFDETKCFDFAFCVSPLNKLSHSTPSRVPSLRTYNLNTKVKTINLLCERALQNGIMRKVTLYYVPKISGASCCFSGNETICMPIKLMNIAYRLR